MSRTDARAFRGVAIRTDDALELRLDRLALAISKPGEARAPRSRAALAALLAGLDALETRLRAGEVVAAPRKRSGRPRKLEADDAGALFSVDLARGLAERDTKPECG
jgi:hypothetical protein